MICQSCAAALPADALNCPNCMRLVHSEQLERLAEQGAQAVAAKQWGAAAEAWRQALLLLPAETKQYQIVQERLAAMEAQHHEVEVEKKGIAKWVGWFGPAGLFLWKFKVILLVALSKGKLLLLGLTKLSTLSTMLLSMGFYWNLYGWWFALGIILSIYIHEMGHVSELRRYGIPASAPMFIPGFGAIVRLNAHPATVGQDARVGLAGPVWGTATALICLVIYMATGNAYWKAIATWGAWINLFNLIPVWQLDGGRAFVALTKRHRWIAAGTIFAMWIYTEDMVLLLLLLGAGFRLLATKDEADQPDNTVLWMYCGLVVVLGLLCMLRGAEGIGRSQA